MKQNIITCPVCNGLGIGYSDEYINNYNHCDIKGSVYEINCQMCNGNGIISKNNFKLSQIAKKGFYPNFEEISLIEELKNKYKNLKLLSEKKEV